MIVENLEAAVEQADSLAIELVVVRPELKSRGCALRVVDSENREVYRTLLDPVPALSIPDRET